MGRDRRLCSKLRVLLEGSQCGSVGFIEKRLEGLSASSKGVYVGGIADRPRLRLLDLDRSRCLHMTFPGHRSLEFGQLNRGLVLLPSTDRTLLGCQSLPLAGLLVLLVAFCISFVYEVQSAAKEPNQR